MRNPLLVTFLTLTLAAPAWAAINPAEFQRAATDTVRIHESARIVHDTVVDGQRLQRVTLVGEVIEQRAALSELMGKTVVIDFTVNLSQRDAAAKEHQARQGNIPGPQFMRAPDAPAMDESGAYWAHLIRASDPAKDDSAHAGAVPGDASYQASGDVFVPAAGQYSFDPPPP